VTSGISNPAKDKNVKVRFSVETNESPQTRTARGEIGSKTALPRVPEEEKKNAELEGK